MFIRFIKKCINDSNLLKSSLVFLPYFTLLKVIKGPMEEAK